MPQTDLSFTPYSPSDHGCHEQVLARREVESQSSVSIHTANATSCLSKSISDDQESTIDLAEMTPNHRNTENAVCRGGNNGLYMPVGKVGLSQFNPSYLSDVSACESKDSTLFQYSATTPYNAGDYNSSAALPGMGQWFDVPSIVDDPFASYCWHKNFDLAVTQNHNESSSFFTNETGAEAGHAQSRLAGDGYTNPPVSAQLLGSQLGNNLHLLPPSPAPTIESSCGGLLSHVSDPLIAWHFNSQASMDDNGHNLNLVPETSPNVKITKAEQEILDSTTEQNNSTQIAPDEDHLDLSIPLYPPLPPFPDYNDLGGDFETWDSAPGIHFGTRDTSSDFQHAPAFLSYSDYHGLHPAVSLRGGHESSHQHGMEMEGSFSDHSAYSGRGTPRDKAMDQFIIEHRAAGMSYSKIKTLGGFKEAESTLRGRYRTLTKPKEARVRKPEWTENDITILKQTVEQYISAANGRSVIHPNHLHRLGSNVQQHALNRVPWKQVADSMANRGCYRFGNATVKKKYIEVMSLSDDTKSW